MRTIFSRILFGVLLFWVPTFAGQQVAQTGGKETMSPPWIELGGSNESQLWQNYIADKEGLFRIQNRKQVLALEKMGALVPLLQSKTIKVDPRLRKDPEYCFVLPSVTDFLKDRAVEYKHDFLKPTFQVNSAVRDAVRQKRIRGSGNTNAADASGPKASSHLTGATIDITKRKMTQAQIEWWREKLLDLECQRVIEATEEFRQACFHIMVFGNYKRMYFDDPTEQPHIVVARKHKGKHRR
jgi:hypothetical protein